MDESGEILVVGERAAIRRFTRSDTDEWTQWPDHPDPLFQDYNSPKMSAVQRDFWYSERLARPDHAMYAILDEDGQLIGRLFLRHMDPSQRTAVLGIDLRSDRLNEGYGSDALEAFNRHFFCDMGYRTLLLDVAAYNFRAQRVYEKLGWVRTGEHWNAYPFVILPDVFTDPNLEPVRRYFRAGPNTMSVLHYDMTLTRDRWEDRQRRER